MLVKNLGKVRIDWKGEWSSTSTYELLDAVEYNGSSYIATEDVKDNLPPTESEYWHIIAKAGKDGENGKDGAVGPQGPKGEQGNQGIPGAKGDAATINIANVIPSDKAEVINLGDQHNAWFEFRLPKGDKGDKGEQGIDGISPHIDPETGNWFIGDQDTGYTAGGNAFLRFDSYESLPVVGNKNFIYLTTDYFNSFVWDDKTNKYMQLNTVNIDNIICGDSNG